MQCSVYFLYKATQNLWTADAQGICHNAHPHMHATKQKKHNFVTRRTGLACIHSKTLKSTKCSMWQPFPAGLPFGWLLFKLPTLSRAQTKEAPAEQNSFFSSLFLPCTLFLNSNNTTQKSQTVLQAHHLGGYSKHAVKSFSHSFRATCDKSTVSLLESGEQLSIKAINAVYSASLVCAKQSVSMIP